ncbi:MAG: hypothetical protein ACRDQ9_02125 [Pseudonocardiaceae bacterium]
MQGFRGVAGAPDHIDAPTVVGDLHVPGPLVGGQGGVDRQRCAIDQVLHGGGQPVVDQHCRVDALGELA